MADQTPDTGISETKLTDEAAAILREVRNFIIVMRGEASESVADFDGATKFLHGDDAAMITDSGNKDGGSVEENLREMSEDIDEDEDDLEVASPAIAALSLGFRRLRKYHVKQAAATAARESRRQHANADRVANEVLRR